MGKGYVAIADFVRFEDEDGSIQEVSRGGTVNASEAQTERLLKAGAIAKSSSTDAKRASATAAPDAGSMVGAPGAASDEELDALSREDLLARATSVGIHGADTLLDSELKTAIQAAGAISTPNAGAAAAAKADGTSSGSSSSSSEK